MITLGDGVETTTLGKGRIGGCGTMVTPTTHAIHGIDPRVGPFLPKHSAMQTSSNRLTDTTTDGRIKCREGKGQRENVALPLKVRASVEVIGSLGAGKKCEEG